MLLLKDAQLEPRRAAVRGPLAALYESLSMELEPLLRSNLFVPESKALLSRIGGRCEHDGTTLEFDPWSPHAHRCPQCGRVHEGEAHHRAWVTSYQLWLAERAVHAALFFLLRGQERHAALAHRILSEYAERYLSYPNRDNVLGPTRLFFSTYLESIWLLQICIAADLLAASGDTSIASLVCEKIVAPSSAIIAEFDEGMSNRQVWNNAALLAAASLRNDARGFERLLSSSSGLHAHLRRALLSDGTWYEGENYHLFALRGLWYGVSLAEARGHALPKSLSDRFHRAFGAPFVTALPDFTMPSRKDSQYAVSLRQWRIAELTELGFARTHDHVLGTALARCYEAGHERGDTGRARSTADVERNVASTALTRADLGWRALLHAVPDVPPFVPTQPRSALLEEQGYAVFRREEQIYVGFEFGQAGGGHGHPDRLNLTVQQGATRWLDDLGTGSYVDPSLHWYRSTLAHNAPLIDGRSQPLQGGELVAYDERHAIGWIVGRFVVDDVVVERAIVVAPDYLVDELRWSAPSAVRLELPLHFEGTSRQPSEPASLDGGAGLEDGFAFVRDVRSYELQHDHDRWTLSLTTPNNPRIFAHLSGVPTAEVFTAVAPGQPPSAKRGFNLVRAHAAEGLFRFVFSWNGELKVATDADGMTVMRGSERHIHRRDERGWHIALHAGEARSSIDLAGFRSRRRVPDIPTSQPQRTPILLHRSKPITFELGKAHYRRSEESWQQAGSPRATIILEAEAGRLVMVARILAGEPTFASAQATNPFDNERSDTMRAGVQLYARSGDASGGWMLVPELDGNTVRVRAIDGWGQSFSPRARWHPRDGGYEMEIELPIAHSTLELDVVINETTSARQRRRGQLVMSGAFGEFVYLRGDRHDAARLIPIAIVP